MSVEESFEAVVRRGYDTIADRYLAARSLAARDRSADLAYLDAFLAGLPPGASILALGPSWAPCVAAAHCFAVLPYPFRTPYEAPTSATRISP